MYRLYIEASKYQKPCERPRLAFGVIVTVFVVLFSIAVIAGMLWVLFSGWQSLG